MTHVLGESTRRESFIEVRSLQAAMRIVVLSFIIVCQIVSSARCQSEPDETGRLVDLLADYQVNQDQVYKSGFAFVGKGVQVREKQGAATVSDRWFLCVHESGLRRLDASSVVMSHPTGRYIESWKQFLRYDGKSMYRPGVWSDVTIEVASDEWKSNEERWKQDRLLLSVPQPLRYLLRSTQGYSYWTDPDSASGSEYLMSQSAVLKECKYTDERDIKAVYSLESNIPVSVEILFSKQHRFFPVKVVRAIELRGEKKIESILDVDWERKKDLRVPGSVRLTTFPLASSGSGLQMEFKFEWKIGSELTAKIDPDLEDWRLPFKDAFKATWQE